MNKKINKKIEFAKIGQVILLLLSAGAAYGMNPHVVDGDAVNPDEFVIPPYQDFGALENELGLLPIEFMAPGNECGSLPNNFMNKNRRFEYGGAQEEIALLGMRLLEQPVEPAAEQPRRGAKRAFGVLNFVAPQPPPALQAPVFQAAERKPLYPCRYCSRQFKLRGALENHEKDIHPQVALGAAAPAKKLRAAPQRFQCQECDYSFGSEDLLRVHWAEHDRAREEQIQYDALLVQAQENAQGGKPIDCNGRLIGYQAKNKLFYCAHCYQESKNKATLKQHSFIHIPKSEWPFQCPDCPERFHKKEALKKHGDRKQCPALLAAY
jgi:hypothetical protein